MNNIPRIDIAAAIGNAPPEIDYVFSGCVAGTVAGIVAPGGVGKSYLNLAIGTMVATGFDPSGGALPGLKSTGPVTYLPAEDPSDILKSRLHYLGKLLPPLIRDSVANNFHIHSLFGTVPDIMDPKWLDELQRCADGQRLVIIDTLRRFHGEEENDNGAMARVIQQFEVVAAATGATILFSHHTGKAGAEREDQHASRGASAITDNIRWQASLSPMSELQAKNYGVQAEARHNFLRFFSTKSNYGERHDSWLRRVEGGVLVKACLSKSRINNHNHQKGGQNADF